MFSQLHTFFITFVAASASGVGVLVTAILRVHIVGGSSVASGLCLCCGLALLFSLTLDLKMAFHTAVVACAQFVASL